MAVLRRFAVSCILHKNVLGEIIHTISWVDAEDENEAMGKCEDEALADNPGYRLYNTAVMPIPDPWDDPNPSTDATQHRSP